MIHLSNDGTQLNCDGRWILSNISDIHSKLKLLSPELKNVIHLNVANIIKMDTAGALFLNDLVEELQQSGNTIKISGLKSKFQPLFDLVSKESEHMVAEKKLEFISKNVFSKIGVWAYDNYLQILSFFAFVGELILIVFKNILNPKRIQWRSILKTLDESGSRALPIVALMSFLVGVVLAYQLMTELKIYGATVFVVDVSGISILREFAPLITAIIMAGRTSTSFAALIGTMKVNEEINALRTMGIIPMERLVMPRILGLIFALPLLTVWADIFGILGSMVMAKWVIDLSFIGYLDRFQQVVALKHLVLGIIKTPVFAMIIAGVGCFQGFQTGTSADSVGWQTTKAAVQAIFLIIVADAGFSILFNIMKV